MENVPTGTTIPNQLMLAESYALIEEGRSKDNNEDDDAAGLAELLLKYQIMRWLGYRGYVLNVQHI